VIFKVKIHTYFRNSYIFLVRVRFYQRAGISEQSLIFMSLLVIMAAMEEEGWKEDAETEDHCSHVLETSSSNLFSLREDLEEYHIYNCPSGYALQYLDWEVVDRIVP